MTSATSSAGWNSQAFRGRKRISEHGKHLEPVFGGKRANLEAQAAHLTPDAKNALLGVRRFQRFLLQKRSGDKLFLAEIWLFCRVFLAKIRKRIGPYRPPFLTTQPDMLKQLGSDAGQGWRLQCQAGGAAGNASFFFRGLVLRRIRSLKRCVMTPRYAPQFGSRLHFKRGQALPKEAPFPFFSGTPFFGTLVFFFFVFS